MFTSDLMSLWLELAVGEFVLPFVAEDFLFSSSTFNCSKEFKVASPILIHYVKFMLPGHQGKTLPPGEKVMVIRACNRTTGSP